MIDTNETRPDESHLPLTERRAYKESIKLLARQDYSRAKMRQKLKQRAVPAEEIEQVLVYLVEKNYLREENYLEARAKGLVTKGLSPKSIQHKLHSEGLEVSQEKIQEFMSDKGVSTDSQLEKLVQKKARTLSQEKLQSPEGRKERDKILRFLLSKGYSFSESKKALYRFLDAPLEADDTEDA